jgi:hypothetical protein
MKATEFLQDNTLTFIERTPDLILSLVIDRVTYGLDVDTSDLTADTVITRTTDFQITDNILTSGDITVDLSSTDMLFSKNFCCEECRLYIGEG